MGHTIRYYLWRGGGGSKNIKKSSEQTVVENLGGNEGGILQNQICLFFSETKCWTFIAKICFLVGSKKINTINMIDKMSIPPSQVSNGASLSNQGCKSWDNNYCTYRRSERSSDAADSLTS